MFYFIISLAIFGLFILFFSVILYVYSSVIIFLRG